MTSPTLPPARTWRFFRAGGFDQVLLETGQDLLALAELDQKLWVALSCPVTGSEFDRRTLELLDSDRDGHIRVPEILAALAWTKERLTDPELLMQGSDGFPLAAIPLDSDAGQRLLAASRAVLTTLEKPDADWISVDDMTASGMLFNQQPFNGDGVITAAATSDPTLQEWLATLVACLGGEPDRSGEAGVSQAMVARFDAEASAWLDWLASPPTEPARLEAAGLLTTLPLWLELHAKIDDYFLRCRLAAYDERAIVAMAGREEELHTLAARNLAEAMSDIAALPLAAVNPTGILPLDGAVNPAWAERLQAFRQTVVQPLLGATTSLTVADWQTLQQRLAPYEAWWQTQPATAVASLGPEQLRCWQETGVAGQLGQLLEQDLALQTEAEALQEVEQLARYCRDLATLLNNFVCFRDFYTRRGKAMFQVGELYLDGRCCELCVAVNDVGKHASLATLSRLYLAYCDCVRDGGAEKMTIAAAVTNGDADHLMIGRNGVFYDRQGRDWDATVVRIVEHPISIRQAFWGPYKRIGKMVGEQLEKLAAAKAKGVEEKGAATLLQAGTAPKPATPPAPFDIGKYVGIFAAIGLALGAIGTAIASAFGSFLKLAWWQMPLALAALLLLISGPAMLIAALKLRQRNLGPLLDANGWAVNARARLNIPFGAALTSLARLPEGSRQQLSDPFADKRTPWKTYFLLLLVLLLLLFLAWQARWLGSCLGK